jgi:flagellar biosynthetic protein FlhB
MADEEDKDSKTQEPSARKLAQARDEGQVAKSPEVASLAALAAASLVILMNGGSISRTIGDQLIPFLAHPDTIDVSGVGALKVFRTAIMAASPAALVLLAALVAGMVGNVAQTGFLFTPKRLAPDIAKLNPISGLSRMFGLDGMVNFLKTFAKFIVMCTVIGYQLSPKLITFQGLAALDLAAVLPFACDIIRAILIASLVMLAVSAALDWFIQRQRFMAKMRQSRQEQKQEHKDSEGDPHIKGKLKQIRMQKSRQRNLQNVPKATMIITNPTHFAVALRYIQGETPAPICVAKGTDELALRIREMATTLSIPIVEDPPLARALYATVEIDDIIPKEHYAAVAKIVGFVMGASKRRRARPLRPVGGSPTPRSPSGRPPSGRGPSNQGLGGRPSVRPEGL